LVFFFSLRPPPPRPTLFPYTTLFRSPLTAVHAPVPVGRRRSLGSAAPVSPPVRAAVRHRRVLGAAPARTSRAHRAVGVARRRRRSEEHTSELQSRENLVCRLLLEKKK